MLDYNNNMIEETLERIVIYYTEKSNLNSDLLLISRTKKNSQVPIEI